MESRSQQYKKSDIYSMKNVGKKKERRRSPSSKSFSIEVRTQVESYRRVLADFYSELQLIESCLAKTRMNLFTPCDPLFHNIRRQQF